MKKWFAVAALFAALFAAAAPASAACGRICQGKCRATAHLDNISVKQCIEVWGELNKYPALAKQTEADFWRRHGGRPTPVSRRVKQR